VRVDTVNWDDGDSTGRTMAYSLVAMDLAPERNEIAVGSRVVFPQGRYVLHVGSSVSGMRYHLGIIQKVWTDAASGETLCSGIHADESETKMQFHEYAREFTSLPISALRVSPNAMDVLMATEAIGKNV
jgi:hypothetical protein